MLSCSIYSASRPLTHLTGLTLSQLLSHYTRLPPCLLSLSLRAMDKTKSKLAAFFGDDDEEPAFPVRRIRHYSFYVHAHQQLPFPLAKGCGRTEAVSLCTGHIAQIQTRERKGSSRGEAQGGRGECRQGVRRVPTHLPGRGCRPQKTGRGIYQSWPGASTFFFQEWWRVFQASPDVRIQF